MNFAAQNVCGAKTLVRGHVEIIPWTEEKSNMLCKSIFKKCIISVLKGGRAAKMKDDEQGLSLRRCHAYDKI